jgi:hypothetical protein
MTTPPGPDEPRYATGYGGARYPLPPEGTPGSSAPQYPGAPQYPDASGQQPPVGQQYGQQYPYGQQQYQPTGGYPYSPYGPPPAGTDSDAAPPSRPGSVVLGLVLMTLAVLPFLAFGLLFLLAPLGPELFPPDVLATPGLAEAGITSADQLVGLLRASGAVLTGLSVVYLVIVVIGFLGHGWARILTAVMTGGLAVLLLLVVLSAFAVDPLSAVFLLVPLVLSVAGIILWFVPRASRWYASR